MGTHTYTHTHTHTHSYTRHGQSMTLNHIHSNTHTSTLIYISIACTFACSHISMQLRNPVARAWSHFQMYMRSMKHGPSSVQRWAGIVKSESAIIRDCSVYLAPDAPVPPPPEHAETRTSVSASRVTASASPFSINRTVMQDTAGACGSNTSGFLLRGLYLRQIQRLHIAFGKVCKVSRYSFVTSLHACVTLHSAGRRACVEARRLADASKRNL